MVFADDVNKGIVKKWGVVNCGEFEPTCQQNIL